MVVGASTRSAFLWLLAAISVPATALAEDTAAARGRAMDLYRQSATLYRQGELERAGQLLERAYALDPNPTLLYNLARVYEGLGRLEAAIDSYRRFLAAAPDARDRGAIEKRIETLTTQLEEQRELRAVERARRQPGEPSPEPAPLAEQPSLAPWLLLGAGGATLLAGTVLGVVSRREGQHARDDETFFGAQAAAERANDYAVAANIAFAVGAAVGLAGATWVLVRPRHPTAGSVDLSIDPGGARISARF